MKPSHHAKQDTYQNITDRILEQMETVGSNWVKPWAGGQSGMPTSISTGKPYQGINTLLLWCQPYSSNQWGTYKAWQDAGKQVKKGEKATSVAFWKILEKEVDGKKDAFPMLKRFCVFNAEQIEGYQPEPLPDVAPMVRHAIADTFIADTGASIEHAGSRAFYRPSTDSITLPHPDQFNDSEAYYSTAFHELTHWTGAKHRLDRLKDAGFGSATYAKEELVAELGAAFLSVSLGLEIEPRADHAQYLNNWIALLKDDKKAIVQAASKAAKAVEFMSNMKAEQVAA